MFGKRGIVMEGQDVENMKPEASLWKIHPVLTAHVRKKLDGSLQTVDNKPEHLRDIAKEDL